MFFCNSWTGSKPNYLDDDMDVVDKMLVLPNLEDLENICICIVISIVDVLLMCTVIINCCII